MSYRKRIIYMQLRVSECKKRCVFIRQYKFIVMVHVQTKQRARRHSILLGFVALI